MNNFNIGDKVTAKDRIRIMTVVSDMMPLSPGKFQVGVDCGSEGLDSYDVEELQPFTDKVHADIIIDLGNNKSKIKLSLDNVYFDLDTENYIAQEIERGEFGELITVVKKSKDKLTHFELCGIIK